MSPALNGSSALQRFERSNAIEIRNGIMFDFYPGLPKDKRYTRLRELVVIWWLQPRGWDHWQFWPEALRSIVNDCQLFTFLYFNSLHWINLHIVLSTRREMDLNQKTLVSQEYCTGFVDCRHTNSQTSYHTICTTGYWEKLGGPMLEAESWFCCLQCRRCKKNSFLFIVSNSE